MRSRLARYLLMLVLPSAVLCLIFLFSLYHEEQLRVRRHLESAEELRLAVGARSLSADIGHIASDIRFIAALPSLQAALENNDRAALARLGDDLVALSAARRVYDQLAWMDEAGVEQVRVDMVQNRPLIVDSDRLQNRAQSEFFTKAMAAAPGCIHVSPLVLNVEDKRVEVPYKPVIRVAIPVHDRLGNAHGVVVATFYGSYLLEKFIEVTDARESAARVNLLNGEGFWLRAPVAADEWGFMFGRRENFGTRFPEAWQRIAREEHGQFEDVYGLWSFVTVRPLLVGVVPDGQRNAEGSQNYVWKVVSRIPPEVIAQAGNRHLAGWIVMTLLFMGALVAGCMVLAKAQHRRDTMAENLRAMNRRLEQKVRARTEELHQQAIRDPLTGLFNRRYLDETLPREIHRATREEQPVSVVMIDLDHFKSFNDTWGHEAGDAILLGVAELLLDGLRASDISCRYGGEELLVVMPGADAAEAVRRMGGIANDMQKLATRVMGRELPPITFSAGVATAPEHGRDAETLVRAADRAMYLAKETGRNRVVVYTPPGGSVE